MILAINHSGYISLENSNILMLRTLSFKVIVLGSILITKSHLIAIFCDEWIQMIIISSCVMGFFKEITFIDYKKVSETEKKLKSQFL